MDITQISNNFIKLESYTPEIEDNLVTNTRNSDQNEETDLMNILLNLTQYLSGIECSIYEHANEIHVNEVSKDDVPSCISKLLDSSICVSRLARAANSSRYHLTVYQETFETFTKEHYKCVIIPVILTTLHRDSGRACEPYACRFEDSLLTIENVANPALTQVVQEIKVAHKSNPALIKSRSHGLFDVVYGNVQQNDDESRVIFEKSHQTQQKKRGRPSLADKTSLSVRSSPKIPLKDSQPIKAARKRGRPKSQSLPGYQQNISDGASKIKRGRGRPPRSSFFSIVENKSGINQEDDTVNQRNNTLPRENGDNIDVKLKRKPGRPQSKPGRGRPRKPIAPSDILEGENDEYLLKNNNNDDLGRKNIVVRSNVEVKRKRGRPKSKIVNASLGSQILVKRGGGKPGQSVPQVTTTNGELDEVNFESDESIETANKSERKQKGLVAITSSNSLVADKQEIRLALETGMVDSNDVQKDDKENDVETNKNKDLTDSNRESYKSIEIGEDKVQNKHGKERSRLSVTPSKSPSDDDGETKRALKTDSNSIQENNKNCNGEVNQEYEDISDMDQESDKSLELIDKVQRKRGKQRKLLSATPSNSPAVDKRGKRKFSATPSNSPAIDGRGIRKFSATPSNSPAIDRRGIRKFSATPSNSPAIDRRGMRKFSATPSSSPAIDRRGIRKFSTTPNSPAIKRRGRKLAKKTGVNDSNGNEIDRNNKHLSDINDNSSDLI